MQQSEVGLHLRVENLQAVQTISVKSTQSVETTHSCKSQSNDFQSVTQRPLAYRTCANVQECVCLCVSVRLSEPMQISGSLDLL